MCHLETQEFALINRLFRHEFFVLRDNMFRNPLELYLPVIQPVNVITHFLNLREVMRHKQYGNAFLLENSECASCTGLELASITNPQNLVHDQDIRVHICGYRKAKTSYHP